MFRSVKYAVLAMLLVAPLSQAAEASRVAVVNSQMALLESVAAKRYAQESEKQFGAQVKKLKALEQEVKSLGQKLDKDGLTMSEAERTKLQMEIRRKREDWEYQAGQLQSAKNDADQKELARLQPKLEEAIQAIASSEGFDLVLERGTARFVKPENDLTRKVIDQLNKLTVK